MVKLSKLLLDKELSGSLVLAKNESYNWRQVKARIRVRTKPRTRPGVTTPGWNRCSPKQTQEEEYGQEGSPPCVKRTSLVCEVRCCTQREECRCSPVYKGETALSCSGKGPSVELGLKGRPNFSWKSWVRSSKWEETMVVGIGGGGGQRPKSKKGQGLFRRFLTG